MSITAYSQQSASEAAATPAVTAQSGGPTLFHELGCAQCHEIRGVGGHKGPDLSGVGRRMKKEPIQKQIALGGPSMPAFGDAIASDEIATLVKYLSHCRDKTPRMKKTVPPATTPTAEPGE